jgi:adenylate kinase
LVLVCDDYVPGHTITAQPDDSGGTKVSLRAPVIVVLGRQGAGKGVQCRRLAEQIGGQHISTGDVLRAAIDQGTALGRQVAPYLSRGQLVPDELMAGLVVDRLVTAKSAGEAVVLDGFPRTIGQAVPLCGPDGAVAVLDVALHIAVPRHLAFERLRHRVVCTRCGLPGVDRVCDACGAATAARDDDQPAAIQRRLDSFDDETRPLLDWLSQQGLLTTVDGTGSVDDVARRIADAVLRPLAGHLLVS